MSHTLPLAKYLPLLAALWILLPSSSQASLAPLTDASTTLGNDWHRHAGFGDYYASGFDQWIYHEKIGWTYIWPEANGSLWLWNNDSGFCWTNTNDVFPWMYYKRREDWLEIQPRSASDDKAIVYSSRENLMAPISELVPPAAPTDADFRAEASPEKIELGRLLFFDKILSGNRNISCATCHHPDHGTGAGTSLPIGEGGTGLGPSRDTGEAAGTPIHERVPRKAPPIWNLGAWEFDTFFHDGRMQLDPSQPSGFKNPAGDKLPKGLENMLAAQAMFPVQSGAEMAGQAGENDIADAAARSQLTGQGGVWDLLAKRLRAIPEYVDLFAAAYSHIEIGADITYVDAANAIGAFEAHAGRADNSAFDRYLRGESSALNGEAFTGMWLFYGEARCASCHSGKFQTDHQFHSIALPQIGTGKGDEFDGHGDFGREQVTKNASDRFRFRTPNLRNVTLSAPYGHSGSYSNLREMVEHHLNPISSLGVYSTSQATNPSRPDLDEIDSAVMSDSNRVADIASSSDLPSTSITSREVDQIMEFLKALEDPSSRSLQHFIPDQVPSGLPVSD